MIRVLVVDDQELVRAGFCAILSARPDIEVVGEAGDGGRAVALAGATRPDVVLMDVRMPGVSGIDATRLITSRPHPPRVLMLTTYDLDESVYESLRAGAVGFLLKDVPRERLVDAVRVAADGEPVFASSVLRRLVETYVRRPDTTRDPPPRLSMLSPREIEVMRLLATGESNAEIAAELFVSEATVKSHVASVLAKLGLRNRVQAVIAAYESGLVSVGNR